MPASFPELIRCRDVTKTYRTEKGPIHALDRTDLGLDSGQTMALVGPSGCGKSTMLLLLSGLEKPTTGLVEFKGKPLLRPHREIALVLQDYGLFVIAHDSGCTGLLVYVQSTALPWSRKLCAILLIYLLLFRLFSFLCLIRHIFGVYRFTSRMGGLTLRRGSGSGIAHLQDGQTVRRVDSDPRRAHFGTR